MWAVLTAKADAVEKDLNQLRFLGSMALPKRLAYPSHAADRESTGGGNVSEGVGALRGFRSLSARTPAFILGSWSPG